MSILRFTLAAAIVGAAAVTLLYRSTNYDALIPLVAFGVAVLLADSRTR